MGTPAPPPNAHIAPLLANYHRAISILSLAGADVYAHPSFRSVVLCLTRSCSEVFVVDLGTRSVYRAMIVVRLLCNYQS
jgi:hypothetical protein